MTSPSIRSTRSTWPLKTAFAKITSARNSGVPPREGSCQWSWPTLTWAEWRRLTRIWMSRISTLQRWGKTEREGEREKEIERERERERERDGKRSNCLIQTEVFQRKYKHVQIGERKRPMIFIILFQTLALHMKRILEDKFAYLSYFWWTEHYSIAR